MASYSMTNGGASSYMGGGWGGDIADFSHSMYSGMSNGMQFANNLYDLQRRVALEPYAQNAAIANYNANTKQDELSADMSGEQLHELNRLRLISEEEALKRGAAQNSFQSPTTAAGISGAATTPSTPAVTGQAVGTMPKTVVPVTAPLAQPTTFQEALLRNHAAPNMSPMPNQGGVFHAAQAQMSYPDDPNYFKPTASSVETNAPAQANPTYQDPALAAGAWSNGRWYG